MAKYKAVKKSFVDGMIVEEGQVIDYNPPEGVTVSDNLVPVTGKDDKHKDEEQDDEKKPAAPSQHQGASPAKK